MKKKLFIFLTAVFMLGSVSGCGGEVTTESKNAGETTEKTAEETTEESNEVDTKAPVIEGLTYESTLELTYAQCFQVYRYEGGYLVIRVDDGRDYIVIPEDGEVPDGLPSSCTVLQKPLDKVYLQATSAISLIDSIDAVDHIRLSGTKVEDWYFDSIISAMENGEVIYAGKYSEPDFELLVSEGCNIAVESTMILHNPEVQEKLEEMGIPVFIDRCTYEPHPLGKTEWVKLYGELFDEQEQAAKVFEEQAAYVEGLEDFENTEKTVAFFYINNNGTVIVRKSSDSIPKMIELAGGRYIFENLGDEENAKSSVDMTMEEFYAAAKDADYIIYNATIDDPIESIQELLEKDSLFADFKAVKEGNVWSTGKAMHQSTNSIGTIVLNFNTVLTDENAEELDFMYRLH